MSKKKATVIFILVAILAIAGWDVYVIASAGFESSISHVMIEWSYKYPIFTFLMGVVMGHLFWRMSDSPTTNKISDFVHNSGENSSKVEGDK